MDNRGRISILGGVCLLIIGAFNAILFGQYLSFGVLYFEVFIGISLIIVGLALIVYPVISLRKLLKSQKRDKSDIL